LNELAYVVQSHGVVPLRYDFRVFVYVMSALVDPAPTPITY